ncbi:hypothetical protein GQX73_g3711 [Xylaria multiplex]|uniref:Zn(2)-C6 fungal-type domain-containing protein n=1 Tax=Xylaria multiplex TaxID=323545 RepID=A0A7C8N6Y4_9PEZI|nr:hypothetical protein GQX73_g3711 [Xylaria multiplex]
MFSSWKLDTSGRPMKRPQVFDPVTAKTRGPQACNHCRAKKVKCTGDKDGCSRCRSFSRVCRYAPVPTKQGQASKKVVPPEEISPPALPRIAWPPCELPTDTGIGGSTTLLQQLPDLPKSPPETPIAWDAIGCPDLEPFFNSNASHPYWGASNETMNDHDDASREAGNSPQSVDELGAANSNPITINPSEIFHLNTRLDPGTLFDQPDALENNALYSFNTVTTIPNHLSQTQIPFQGPARQLDSSEYASQPGSPGGQFDLQTLNTSLWKKSPLSCACLDRMALLMDEVDLLGEIDFDNLDAALAIHKGALRHGRNMTMCSFCTGHIEHMIMLTFLTDKMASLCRQVSNKIFRLPASSSPSIGLTNCPLLLHEDRGLVLGSYGIDSLEEYQALLRGLLRLHLRELLLFLEHLKHVARRLKSETMIRRLAGTALSLEVLAGRRFEQ